MGLSFAAGYRAKATHDGSFVWSDYTSNEFASTAANQFDVRATGGVYLYTTAGMTTGAMLAPGSGTWASFSDRNGKANFAPANGKEILARLNAIPIQTWNYKTEDPSIRHIGPMAQDFYAAFQVGEDDKHITSVDSEGVALAAIQGLYQQVQEKDAKIEAQQKQIEALDARLTALEQRGRVQPGSLGLSDGLSAPVWMLVGLAGYAVFQRARRGGMR